MNGSIFDGCRQRISHNFVLYKPAGCQVFCAPETIHYRIINKSVLNTITFYLEDDNHEQIHFNGRTLTFTPQMSKFK